MSEERNEANQPPQGEPTVASRTASGALQLVVDISQNPTVATAVGGSAVVGVAKLLSGTKEPPPPDPPPHGGLWVPPSAED